MESQVGGMMREKKENVIARFCFSDIRFIGDRKCDEAGTEEGFMAGVEGMGGCSGAEHYLCRKGLLL